MFLHVAPSSVWNVHSFRASVVFRNHRFVHHIIWFPIYVSVTFPTLCVWGGGGPTCVRVRACITLCISVQLNKHKACGHCDCPKFNRLPHKLKSFMFNFSFTSFLWGLIMFIFTHRYNINMNMIWRQSQGSKYSAHMMLVCAYQNTLYCTML
jgi:hypothetical protein